MHYRKLGIQLVKDENPLQCTFSQNMLSFIAITFFVRRNNTKRKGVLYYKHLREHSFVNYVVKITLSSISSSVGVKKNREYIKQYKQELKITNCRAIKL